MQRELQVPGTAAGGETERALLAAEDGRFDAQALAAAGFALELHEVIEVASSRDAGAQTITFDVAADGARTVCQVELESGARLWLRPETVLALFGAEPARPSRGAAAAGVENAAWRIDPLVAPTAAASRGAFSDRMVKIAKWVVTLGGGAAQGALKGHPVHHLARAIEDHQHGGPPAGVCTVSLRDEPTLTPAAAVTPAPGRPLLVFLHGTMSSTLGSFGGLWDPARPEGAALRAALIERYGETACALEHYTLLEDPIANALALVQALPKGTRLHLVSHSRGGLIGELLCLAGARDKVGFSPARIAELLRLRAQEPDAVANPPAREHWIAQADRIEALVRLLYEKELRVERFARVACPSQGTTLAMRRFDLWLSVYKHVVDAAVEGLALRFLPPAVPLRALIGLVSEPEAADQLPGVWSMVPGNPLVSLVNFQALEVDADLSVISGRNEGQGALQGGLSLLLERFFRDHNDWVVNTGAMYGGLPRGGGQARFQLDQGPEVNHFRYFVNDDSVRWLRAALLRSEGDAAGFRSLDEAPVKPPALRAELKPRAVGPRPVVFMLPGIMGSEIAAGGENIWLHYNRIARGRIGEIAIDAAGVEATRPLPDFYGEWIETLGQSHEVVPFAYDWRQSIFAAAARLAEALTQRLDEQQRQAVPMPVRICAHSLGGLVVRALIASHGEVWRRFAAQEGARVMMLGTPSGGSFEIVRLLLAQSGTLHALAMLDLTRGPRGLLSIIQRYPGVLELLPQGEGEFFVDATWQRLQALDEVGAGLWTPPEGAALAAAQAAVQRLALSADDARRIVYVAGCADETPSGWVEDIERDFEGGSQRRTIAFTCSAEGDGRVLWASGIPPAVSAWYMPGVSHGDLCNTPAHFPALLELLAGGDTARLPRTPPARRAAAVREPLPLIRRDVVEVHPSSRAGPAGGPGVLDQLLARSPSRAARVPLPGKTRVRVVHGDLAYARFPVLIGHYAGDTMVGAEAALDSALHGALRRRSQLGLYAGPVGTATVELQSDRRARPAGAIVIGLGRPDQLTPRALGEGAMRAALEYALARIGPPSQLADGDGRAEAVGARLSCLLVGSGAGGLTVRNVVMALLGGIGAANRKLAEHGLSGQVWIDEIELLDLWLDKATQAAEALDLALIDGDLAGLFVLDDDARSGSPPRALVMDGEGGLRRIDTAEAPSWWQRLEIGYDRERHRLHFVAMGDRARAEQMLASGQMETAERFIEEAIGSAARNAEVSRTLFEMLVPNRIKELAPDQQDMWLLVDEASGAFPWELLEDRWTRDGKPLAVAAGMLRQFKTIEFRDRPTTALGDFALVVANPALPELRDDFPFLELAGAQREGSEVASQLEAGGFEVAKEIHTTPSRIFARLHAKEYRILHLAGHGVHEWKLVRQRKQPAERDGDDAVEETVSGMLIGDQVFLTPGDVEQMRFLPELVFINCCHLGRLGGAGRSQPWRMGNKLAANLAAQFIRMGVRAVVAAGWEVDDQAALTFARSFYGHLLAGQAFGAAVKRAREATYLRHGNTNTWGAFQCYGDPNWQLRRDLREGFAAPPPAAPPSLPPLRSVTHAVLEFENLRDRLRVGQGWAAGLLDARLRQLKAEEPAWLADAGVAEAVGLTLGELERFDEAIGYLDVAIVQGGGQVSLRAVEKRAHYAVKLALRRGLAETAGTAGRARAQQELKAARDTVAALLQLGVTIERLALLGSAWKREAWLATDAAARRQALHETYGAYRQAHERRNGVAGQIADPFPTTNLLTALAVLRWFPVPAAKGAAKVAVEVAGEGLDTAALAGAASQWAEDQEARQPTFWTLMTIADCRLVSLLLRAAADPAAGEDVLAHYRRAVDRGASDKELGSVREQLDYVIHMARLARRKVHLETLQAVRALFV